MAFWNRKKKEETPALKLDESLVRNLVYQAGLASRSAFRLWQAIAAVPGLIEHGKSVVPKLLPYAITQNFDGMIGVVAGDPILGPIVTDVVKTIKSNIEDMKGQK